MHLLIASGLLIVCGIVDATFYNPRSQAFNQLMERRQRSIGLQYPYGYHYNPIEPSINDLDGLSEAVDSRINEYKPIYEHVKMSTHEVNSVPRTHSYNSKNSLYDSEYMTRQDIPSLFPEDSYDYKYLGSPLNKYLTNPSTTERSIPINLVAIRKTSVFGYGFPTYKSPYPSDSVTIVKLSPETLEHEPTPTTTKNPYDFLFVKLLSENQNEVKNLVKDESNYEITQETPTKDELNPFNSEESQTVDQSNILVLEENLTEDKSNSITTEETQTEDESNSPVFEDTPITNEIESNLIVEENLTEDKSNSITTEETQTEDELNSLVFDSITTEDESNSFTTEDESNSITTEDESNYITTEDESNSITTEDESNSITTEETQTEGDESTFTTSQETTTAFKRNPLNSDSVYDRDMRLKIMGVLENYLKFREQEMNRQFTTIDNISAKFQSNVLSDEDMSQPLVPKVANEAEQFDEYDSNNYN
ncbi:uncharacterized protein LOC111035015 [Myzus persicae]|uniref:uncharacterized protein LOC111035015 n=1 Tax=Myzus persicae TaxID=13164 RepID=UPI000B939E31|nr:uncharacterized protein LOC111035015 [Myzus persicae]